jgi:hypothetical protein
MTASDTRERRPSGLRVGGAKLRVLRGPPASPSRTRVYAADASGDEVWAVDRRGGRLVQTIPLGRHPVHLAFVSAG